MRSLLMSLATCIATAGAHAGAFQLEPSSDVGLALGSIPPSIAAADPAPQSGGAWGRPNSFALNVTAGYADDFEDTSIVPIAVGVSWFPIRGVSLDLQGEGAFVQQPGDDSAGAGLAFMIRWHFIDREQWSIYADLGVGFLAMSDPVPANAADFVFTPRAGVGFSYALTDATRLLAGARWFHISNAQTASENPGVNALQLYAGVSFGF